jgi:CheY-like chemotaxis protein
MKGDREEMLEAGCTDYLSKPFSKPELLTLIDKYLKK